MTLDSIDIVEAWRALGGGELRGKRGRAFWRNGDGYSISLNRERGAWYDFRDGCGGGILDLVMTARGCTRKEAFLWLETHCGLDVLRPLTRAERRRYARAEQKADTLARRLSDFHRGLVLVTEEQLTVLSDALADIDPPELLAELHRHTYILTIAAAGDIANTWRSMRAENNAAVDAMERVGRGDREHAEIVTWAIVDLLARSKRAIAA